MTTERLCNACGTVHSPNVLLVLIDATASDAVAVHVNEHECLDRAAVVSRMISPGVTLTLQSCVTIWRWHAPKRRQRKQSAKT